MNKKFFYLISTHRQKRFAIIAVDHFLGLEKGSWKVVGSLEERGFVERALIQEKGGTAEI